MTTPRPSTEQKAAAPRGRGAAWALLSASLFLLGQAFVGAGEAPAAGGPRSRAGTPAPAAQPEEEVVTDPELMDLRQLQRHQRFVYVTGGRDPFTFRLPVKVEKPAVPEEGTGEDGPLQPVEVDPTKPPSAEAQEAALLERYLPIRALIIAAEYNEAFKLCEEAKKLVDDWGTVSGDGTRRLYERILSLRSTAQRLANRAAIQAEFESLPLKVEGVRWSPKGSAALVNDVVVEPGMSVQVGAHGELQIESVDEEGVIFIYKGQRLRRDIETPDEGASP